MESIRRCARYAAAFLLAFPTIISCNVSSGGDSEYGHGLKIEINVDEAVPFIANVGKQTFFYGRIGRGPEEVLGFDPFGRLVLITRSETPHVIYCSVTGL